MRRRSVQSHTDGLAALLLFGIFAVCVLAVLLTGADAYRHLTQRDQAAYSRRTCVQYVATRVRQADRQGFISVVPFGQGEALVLREDEVFETKLYCQDGWLMELYTYAGADMAPEDGTPLMEAAALSLALEDGLLTVEVTTSAGETDTLCLSLRSSAPESVDTPQPSPAEPAPIPGLGEGVAL